MRKLAVAGLVLALASAACRAEAETVFDTFTDEEYEAAVQIELGAPSPEVAAFCELATAQQQLFERPPSPDPSQYSNAYLAYRAAVRVAADGAPPELAEVFLHLVRFERVARVHFDFRFVSSGTLPDDIPVEVYLSYEEAHSALEDFVLVRCTRRLGG